MFRQLLAKIRTVWVVITSSAVHIVYQKSPGQTAQTGGYGRGDLRDLVLMSTAVKTMYEGFIDMINEAAANSGDLHSLQQLRDAVDVIEKEKTDVKKS